MSNVTDVAHCSIGKYYPKQSQCCWYCSNSDGSYFYGLHTHSLRVEDYQDMIDRGWRRCGNYCYKEVMDQSCCPLYTIRCATQDFKLSKTQKKILKKFNNFLINGIIIKNKIYKSREIMQPMDIEILNHEKKNVEEIVKLPSIDASFHAATNIQDNFQIEAKKKKSAELKDLPSCPTNITVEQKSKNKCMKAKQLRIQRKRQKLQNSGYSEEEICKKLVEKKRYPVVKTIEDFLKELDSKTTAHNLKILLVRSCPRSENFNSTFAVTFDLYKRYQIYIHKNTPEELTQDQFEKFLVKSPLQALNGYGSYHQQYWLDDKLIAVGVIDILPKCVSSVYFFYDPDYAHLSLGTYGALREVHYTRMLSSRFPDLIYYYMGFYIHSCVKMKYKAAFKPSYLLCPEVYTWHPIEKCLPKIEASKYSRLNEDPNACDMNADINPHEVFIIYKNTAMSLNSYSRKKKSNPTKVEETMECARLIGKNCAKKFFLIVI